MPKLIILRGNSGSGKTSAAKALQKKFGANTLLISQDVVRKNMLSANDGFDTPAIKLLTTLLNYGYENCDVTILEGILKAEWYRPLFETTAQLYQNEIFAYYYDIPFEETLKRHSTKTHFEFGKFGENEMKKWWNEKDYIGFIPEKKISSDFSLDEEVTMIFNDVNALN